MVSLVCREGCAPCVHSALHSESRRESVREKRQRSAWKAEKTSGKRRKRASVERHKKEKAKEEERGIGYEKLF